MDIVFRNLIEPDLPTPEEEYRRLASSEVPFEAAFARMMLELLDALRRDVVGPRLVAHQEILGPGLQFVYSDGRGHSTAVSVNVDYKDRSPVVDELPSLHYRLACATEHLSEELRARNVQAACEFIQDAIRKCGGTT